ncbi:prolipoprotein diacylglyceryl transferase [candidate division KSB1 bacterium]|nr:prolipoprotein diacylglyceryl transferase [candidate division KSB1 bacterium]NIR70706.1 prolipoprotein diacylglyceryl transferase [candidate division KSB1 bacterium]NIS27763.1 prolipoprotein diacylglyceryl transferase [candidate division KSB1 bacterium]NIT74610.1 prolipoprotein diacylglyceryl transferase [candidate division KSB1 bacterium]NIU28430.1 prolipoprotein diacylglyceryl transferase [candidate division KSB1 bacterium]
MIPELIEIGPFTIGSFGVMAMLAFLIPTLLLRKEFARKGLDPELASGVAISAMVGGFLGARIYFIAERWDIFFADPAIRFGVYMMLIAFIPAYFLKKHLEKKNKDAVFSGGITLAVVIGVLLVAIIYYIKFNDARTWGQFVDSRSNLIFTGAGLVWYGGLAGGFLMVSWYVHHNGIKIPVMCDLMAPMLALGQTFGRMGCLLSGDGDYGPPTDVPWAMAFPEGIVPTQKEVHPTPIYDMIFLITIFVVLWNIRKNKLPTGFKFSLYLIMMGGERIITEFFRTTPEVFLGLTTAQLISIGLIIIGGTRIFVLKSKQKSQKEAQVKEPQKAKV